MLQFFAQMGSSFLQNFFAVFSLSVQAAARLKPLILEFAAEHSTSVPQLQPVWLKIVICIDQTMLQFFCKNGIKFYKALFCCFLPLGASSG
jgi:hypothetical protein